MSNETIDVALYWSPQEAAAVLDYLDRLRDLIWEYYAEDITELRFGEVLTETENQIPEQQQSFSFESEQSQEN